MRIRLTLRPQEKETVIPINYQYPLSAAIYKILSNGSPDYATWLHARGYLSPDKKPIKLFVFSKLFIPQVKIKQNALIAHHYHRCTMIVSSPMLEDFVQNFVIGLFATQKIEIGSKEVVGRFIIEQVETLPTPEFSRTTRFKCLSPITLSTKKEKYGSLQEHYYRPSEPELAEAIRDNLIAKYETVHQKQPDDSRLEFKLDKEYLQKKGGDLGLSKLIIIKEGTSEETKVKAFECLFYLTGSQELQQIAWDCGIGQRNSLGFGMVDGL
jgi:CRISPR-associated endoribonuclease Cas6